LARLQNYARRAVLGDNNSSHGRTEANLGASSFRRAGESLGERAETAYGLRQRGRCPTAGRQAVQQCEHAARRSRPEVGAEHRIESERTLEKRTLEVLI